MQPDALAEIIVTTIAAALAPLKAHLDRLETALAERTDGLKAAEATIGTLRERLAGLEARPPVPGPAGADGRDGLDGLNGADGIGFDDLGVTFDGERTLALTFTRGPIVKTFPIVLPIPRYHGIYAAGLTYSPGDMVTWSGSAWYCKRPTTARPGESGSAWQLMVKAGRDLRNPERPNGTGA
jgi:hypothetical protein